MSTYDGEQIREKLQDFCNNTVQCGFSAFLVKKNVPQLKRIAFSEQPNGQGKTFRAILKDMFFEILKEEYLSKTAEYADGSQLADNQHKYLIFEQGERFHPFSYLNDRVETSDFVLADLEDAFGLAFQIRKDGSSIWLYQHLWSIMVPNKKKTNPMARLMQFENKIFFSEQRESLLTIARKIDIIIIDHRLITGNITLLQKYFGFQDYIQQSARQTAQKIAQKGLVANSEKLAEYISRGNCKYAKKMMRIGSSKVFGLSKTELVNKINTLPRWRGKFNVDQDQRQIVLKTYKEVEALIDLFDERYTRSEVTNTEYDTDVKTVAAPTMRES